VLETAIYFSELYVDGVESLWRKKAYNYNEG
jgi:hypothetical protein